MAKNRNRIRGHKSAFTKLKEKLAKVQQLANDRAAHMKEAGLIVRHPR